jgi:hypothetical protein
MKEKSCCLRNPWSPPVRTWASGIAPEHRVHAFEPTCSTPSKYDEPEVLHHLRRH